MTKKWTQHVASAVLCTSVAWLSIGSSHAEELTPIDVTNLYLKALINHDKAAVDRINDYLRPTRSGNNLVSYEEMKASDATYPADATKAAMDYIPAAYQKRLTPLLMDIMRSENDDKRSTPCRALDVTPMDDVPGQKAVKVSFECQVLKMPEEWPAVIRRLSDSKHSLDDYIRELQALKRGYDAHPTAPLRMDFMLGHENTPNGIWRNNWPLDVTDKILNPDD